MALPPAVRVHEEGDKRLRRKVCFCGPRTPGLGSGVGGWKQGVEKKIKQAIVNGHPEMAMGIAKTVSYTLPSFINLLHCPFAEQQPEIKDPATRTPVP